MISPEEKKIARDSLERYSNSNADEFGKYVILTNFPQYVDYFAESRGVPVHEGSMLKVAHSPSEDLSIVDFKIGSPAAALVIDLCARIPEIQGGIFLGMCGGLRRHYHVGDYFVPVASIRGESTSDFYFPPEVPALANFLIQRVVSEVLDEQKIKYYIGITHSTNIRFWEFNEPFKDRLKANRAQGIEMECATLFTASYRHKFPLGSLLLISDLPLNQDGVKTKDSSKSIFSHYTEQHVEQGVKILRAVNKLHLNHGYQRKKHSF